MDLGIPMKVEIQRDSSTSNSLTDRLGAGPQTKYIDTHFWCTRASSRWRSQYQEGAHSEKLCRCWNEASLCFQCYSNIASLQDWCSTDDGSLHSTTRCSRDRTSIESSRRRRCRTENRNRQMSELVVNIETGVKAG